MLPHRFIGRVHRSSMRRRPPSTTPRSELSIHVTAGAMSMNANGVDITVIGMAVIGTTTTADGGAAIATAGTDAFR